MDGGNIRESHSYNSGVNIIEKAQVLRDDLRYSNAQIAEAALLAFAHSKSNSGLNPLTNNPAGWSFAIQALQAATADSGFDLTGALKEAGIIKSTEPTGEAKATVKAPKRYKTDPETRKIIFDEKGKPVVDESCYARDEKGNIKKDKDGKPITKFEGNVPVYEFDEEAIKILAYEALSIRIGDALTNNDNGKINQFGGKIIIDDSITDYSKQWTWDEIVANMLKPEDQAVYGTSPEEFLSYVLDGSNDFDLASAASAETKHPKYNSEGRVATDRNGKTVYDDSTSVLFQVEDENGSKETYNESQEFVLGENNQTYSVTRGPNGISVKVSVKNSNAVPFCTLFAIEERVGELKSFVYDNNSTAGTTPITLVIELDSNTDSSIRKLYEQYAKECKKDGKIDVGIITKMLLYKRSD